MMYQIETRRTAAHRWSNKRRRVRRRMLGLGLLLVGLLFGIGCLIQFVDSMMFHPDWSSIGVSAGTMEAVSALAKRDKRAKTILESPEKYPTVLLDMLALNGETLDFVLDYPSHHGDPPAESLNEDLDTMPLLLQWDERWGYQDYGGSTIAVSGCAPTALAMAASYLTKNPEITPYATAKYAVQQGYYVPGVGTSWDFIHSGAQAFGVSTKELPLDESVIRTALDAGAPVICSMLPGDFTTSGHFIVLSGMKDSGYIVRDPNSRIRSDKIWTYEELKSQINNLWECWLNG